MFRAQVGPNDDFSKVLEQVSIWLLSIKDN